MFKRIMFFILMNAAILIVANIFLFILGLFWVNTSTNTYGWLFIFCLVASFVWTWISLLISRWIAKKTYDIKLIDNSLVHSLSRKEMIVWQTVKSLAERNHIKMPEVWFYEDSEPNAFATWATKNSSLVAVSTGLMEMMNEDAIEWVVAHEMAHILNWDMVTMAMLQWVLNTFVLFFSKIIAQFASTFAEDYAWIVRLVVDIILQIIFGILASIVAMWFSRHREFRADAWSAKYVWKEKMIAWLRALQNMQNMMKEKESQFSTMQISSKKANGFMKLFSSHPDLEDRILALQNSKEF